MEEDYVRIQCPGCGQVQHARKIDEHTTVKCTGCGKQIIANAMDQSGNLQQRTLPGTTLAVIWNVIGVLLLVCAALAFLAAFGEGDALLLIAAQLALCSMGPFSVTAIIRAINANTLEVRKLGKQ